jgi:large subunit ribosomal protein L2
MALANQKKKIVHQLTSETLFVKKYKPTTPGARHRQDVVVRLGPNQPMKALLAKKSHLKQIGNGSGRGRHGEITVRHQGGGHKKLYRIIDFKRSFDHIPAKVTSIEYDPFRSALIALVSYRNGAWRYILHPSGLKVGDLVESGNKAEIKVGNCLSLSHIPVGTQVHNVEMNPGQGGKIARSAGCFVTVISKDDVKSRVMIRLKSGETRYIHHDCRATVGQVSKSIHNLSVKGKAGASRWRGIRPTVRGACMNPIDHPHGGGEGRSKGGRHPVSPTGMPTKGHTTRSNKRTDKMIVRSRRNKKA